MVISNQQITTDNCDLWQQTKRKKISRLNGKGMMCYCVYIDDVIQYFGATSISSQSAAGQSAMVQTEGKN